MPRPQTRIFRGNAAAGADPALETRARGDAATPRPRRRTFRDAAIAATEAARRVTRALAGARAAFEAHNRCQCPLCGAVVRRDRMTEHLRDDCVNRAGQKKKAPRSKAKHHRGPAPRRIRGLDLGGGGEPRSPPPPTPRLAPPPIPGAATRYPAAAPPRAPPGSLASSRRRQGPLAAHASARDPGVREDLRQAALRATRGDADGARALRRRAAAKATEVARADERARTGWRPFAVGSGCHSY